jgi:hypothetical protein
MIILFAQIFFYLQHDEGRKSLILPNDREIKEYYGDHDTIGNQHNRIHYQPQQRVMTGYVAICFMEFCHIACPQGVVLRENIVHTSAAKGGTKIRNNCQQHTGNELC